ncbi:MAG: hypothetical protein FXF47_08940 [Candidatus Mcinerneyibacterium aminivorans]|uniref:NTPase n=1 Tax=Candidatus Mcinerneyibacterium aminivorans TaxID=2703815 RepID=A0A5D0MG97_9BACT|nr:MAG: hypothetical protein FXF47_08940 [Candidatus Mcinerneyibacterium aminivorans]
MFLENTVVKKNIFLTGKPGIGKTTGIKRIISKLDKSRIKGFITAEKRNRNERTGFLIKTLNDKMAYMAHVNFDTDYKLGKYFVSVENINKFMVQSMNPDKNSLIILDEIGKMECLSEKFKTMVLKVLESSNKVLGTISVSNIKFIKDIHERKDTEILNVNLKNRDKLADKLISSCFLDEFR